MSMCHLYVLLGEVSIHVLCHFLIGSSSWCWVIWVLHMWCVFWRVNPCLMYLCQICSPIQSVPFSYWWCFYFVIFSLILSLCSSPINNNAEFYDFYFLSNQKTFCLLMGEGNLFTFTKVTSKCVLAFCLF